MSNAIRTLRATATAGLIAAALLLGPAAAAFADSTGEPAAPAPASSDSSTATPKKQFNVTSTWQPQTLKHTKPSG
jgi:uncharacterized membrane protein YdfJ with MMPL/SSD domain